LEAEPKIEREKIRRPPSDDPRFTGAEAPKRSSVQSARPPADVDDETGDYYDSAHEDWTVESGASSTWDDDPEADWVLDPGLDDTPEELVDEGDVDDYVEEEDDAGVVWEDDDLPDQMTLDGADQMIVEDENDITFDDYDTGFGTTPEVELAGRRDVSPRAPRPVPAARAAPARPATPRRTARQQQPQQPPSQQRSGQQRKPRQQQQTARQPLGQWEAPRQAVERTEAPRLAPLEPTPKPAPTSTARPAPRPVEVEPVDAPRRPPAGGARSSTRPHAAARGPAEALIIGDAPGQALPQASGGGAGRRRRQSAQRSALAFPPSPRQSSGRGRRSNKGLLPLIAVVLIGIAGWFGYQRIDPATIQPTLDRIISYLPFPASTRTAEDSSFGGDEALENLTAEQALSYLEDRALSQNGAQTGAPQTNGPPIPKFKPLAGETPPEPVTRSAAGPDKADNAAQDASIIEQIIRYINPG
jgi:hypothetical protein